LFIKTNSYIKSLFFYDLKNTFLGAWDYFFVHFNFTVYFRFLNYFFIWNNFHYSFHFF